VELGVASVSVHDSWRVRLKNRGIVKAGSTNF
jgi:hypothetical protein